MAVIVEALVLAAVGAFVVVRLEGDLTMALDSTLVARADQLTTGNPDLGNFTDPGQFVVPGLGHTSGLAQVLARDGRVVQSAGAAAADRPLLDRTERQGAAHRPVLVTRNIGGFGEIRLLGVPAGSGQVLVVGSSLQGVRRATDDLTTLLLVGGLIALGASGVGAWVLARRALRPIDRMTATAAAIGVDDLDQRITVPPTGDEVARLAQVINGLLERVDRALAEQKAFLADVSHELRSPVAVLRAELEVALRDPATPTDARQTLESVHEEASRLVQLTENLLALARADARQLDINRREVALEQVAERALRLLTAPAARKGVTLDRSLGSAPAWGDIDRLTQVAANLLENAVNHAPNDSRVVVETGVETGTAILAVTDQGPGVPAAFAAHVFDRFSRADSARPRGGTGLGLAIAKSIAQAHGGDVTLERTGPSGTRFVLRIPERT